MRSLLFVPADGGPKLDKAMASGADAIIIDLEDSITPERKSQARSAALEFLKSAVAKKQRPRILVRINGLDTGMTDVKFPNPLFEGDTVNCTTTVVSKRVSKSRPGAGIVEFHHKAFKQDGTLVAECHRNAFINMRPK